MGEEPSFYDNIMFSMPDSVKSTAGSIGAGLDEAWDGVSDYFSGTPDGLTGPNGLGSSRTLTPLDEFIGHVKKNGVTRPNRFRITIPLPTHVLEKLDPGAGEDSSAGFVQSAVKVIVGTEGGREGSARSLQIMCQVASFPGVNVDTAELKAGGKPRKMAYGLSYDNADFAFVVSGDMREKKIFDYWIKTVVDPTTAAVGYYDDYIVDITIEQLDVWGNSTHGVILEDAYPVVVTPMELDMGSANTAAMLRTSFTYRRQVPMDKDVTERTASGLPGSADQSLFGQVMDNFRPAQIIKDVMNGDISGAVNKAADVYMDAVTGNWGEELTGVYKTVSDVSRKFTGLGARELETIYGVVKGDVAKNGKIGQADKAELMRVITGVMGSVKKVGGPPTAQYSQPKPSTLITQSAKDAALLQLDADEGITT